MTPAHPGGSRRWPPRAPRTVVGRGGVGVAVVLVWLAAPVAVAQPSAGPQPAPRVAQGVRPAEPSLAHAVGRDYSRFFTSAGTLVALGAGLGASAALAPLDDPIATSRFNAERYDSPAVDLAFEAGELLGGTIVQLGGAFATYGLGAAFGGGEAAALGRDLVRAQLLAGGVTQLLKYTVGRERPDRSSARSFPSGHASGTFATAAVLHGRYGWRTGVASYAVASYVAASRLSEDKHYLSDVIFGAAIGLTAGRTVSFEVATTRFSLSPLAARGGAGVLVSVLRVP